MSSILKKALEENGITPSGQQGGANDANNGNTNTDNNTTGANTASGGANQSQQGTGDNNTSTGGNNSGQSAAPPQTGDDDIEDARLLAILAKRGIQATSIADLNKPQTQQAAAPSEEEQRAAAEKRQSDITAYGLSKGKITRNELERFSVDVKKDPIDLAFEIFRDQRMKELKAANTPKDELPKEDDLIKEFNEYNHLEYDETDPKRIRREQELAAQADAYLKSTYKKIYDLDKDYEDHETGIQTRSGFTSKVETAVTKIPAEIVLSIPDISDKSGKTMLPYRFKPSQQTINAVKEKYSSEGMIKTLGQGDLTVDALAEAMLHEAKLMEFDRIVSEVAHAHAAAELEKAGKGRRNIVETPAGAGGGTPVQSSPVMKKILDENKNLLQTS